MKEGYITIATGDRQYLEMATNFAASIRQMDPGRELCLVHDEGAELSDEVRHLFHHLVPVAPDPAYPTVMLKLRLFELSPFDRTMFVDADSLMVKPDIDRYWKDAAGRALTIIGGKITSGELKGRKVADLMRDEQVDYIWEVHGGVFCFERTEASRAFFDGLLAFYHERREFLRVSVNQGRRKFSDEMFFGIYMARIGMQPVDRDPSSDDSWMVTTYATLGYRFRPERGESRIYKATGFYRPPRFIVELPLVPKGFKRLSPTFVHFIQLKPNALYQRLAAQFRAAAARVANTTP